MSFTNIMSFCVSKRKKMLKMFDEQFSHFCFVFSVSSSKVTLTFYRLFSKEQTKRRTQKWEKNFGLVLRRFIFTQDFYRKIDIFFLFRKHFLSTLKANPLYHYRRQTDLLVHYFFGNSTSRWCNSVQCSIVIHNSRTCVERRNVKKEGIKMEILDKPCVMPRFDFSTNTHTSHKNKQANDRNFHFHAAINLALTSITINLINL